MQTLNVASILIKFYNKFKQIDEDVFDRHYESHNQATWDDQRGQFFNVRSADNSNESFQLESSSSITMNKNHNPRTQVKRSILQFYLQSLGANI